MRDDEFLRTPVSGHVAADDRNMVLCDDGSAWKWHPDDEEWYEFTAPIPETVRDTKRSPFER